MKHIKRLNNKQLSSVRTKIQFQRFNELNAMQFFRKYISSRNFKFQSSRGKLDLRQQFLRDISYPLPLGYGTEYRPTTSRITINPRRGRLTKEITSHLGPTESPSPPWARISGEKAFSRVARGHPFHWKWKRFPLVLDISEPRPLLQREKPRLLKTERRGAAFHASARTYRFPVAFSPRVISFHRFSQEKLERFEGGMQRIQTHDFGTKSFIEKVARRSTSTCVKDFVLELGFRVFLSIAFVRFNFWETCSIVLDDGTISSWIHFLFEIIFRKSYVLSSSSFNIKYSSL